MRQIKGYSLWLGHVGDIGDLHRVLSASVLAVIDLAIEEPIPSLTRDLVYCRFPLLDGSGNEAWLLRAAINTIAGFLRAEIPTLVYCGAGMSRTPTIAGAAISQLQGCSLIDGLKIVSQEGPLDVSPSLLSEVQAALHENPNARRPFTSD